MAILIDAPTTEVIRYTDNTGTVLADMQAWTCILWTKTPATMVAFKQIVIMEQTGAGTRFIQTGNVTSNVAEMGANIFYSGVNLFYSTAVVIPASTWVYLATSYDNLASANDFVRFFYGTLTAKAALQAHTYNDEPTGTKDDDTGSNLDLGDPTLTGLASHAHTPARMFIYPNRLTDAQIIAHQFATRPMYDGCILHWEFGIDGILTVPDFTGNGLNASVSGSPTVADHVPSGPPFGFDEPTPYIVATATGNPWYYYAQQAAVAG